MYLQNIWCHMNKLEPPVPASDDQQGLFYSSLNALHLLVEAGTYASSQETLLQDAMSILINGEGFEYCAFYDLSQLPLSVTTASVDDEFQIQGQDDFIHGILSAEKSVIEDQIQSFKNSACAESTSVQMFSGQQVVFIAVGLFRANELAGMLLSFHPDRHFFNVWHSRTLAIYSKTLMHVLSALETRQSLEEKVKARTQEMEKARDEAFKNSRAKSEFLAKMSHEIRTPMNAIIGFGQLLQKDPDSPLSEEHEEYVSYILDSGNHLLELVNDVLDMSKIESGRMELKLDDVPMDRMLQELSSMFKTRAQKQGLEWKLIAEVASDLCVRMDAQKLRQVLINLLSNAFKFTEQGFVHLTVSEPENSMFHFEVLDTGMGMTREEMESIFEPFVQKNAGEKYGGTGLGLSIAQKQIELMGGEIKVQSVPEQGSCFSFDIELEKTTQQAAKRHQSIKSLAPGQTISALVVDDEKVNRLVLTELLQKIGVQTYEATNGVEALESLKSYNADIVFLDYKMPVMNGLEALKYIQDMATHPKCVAVSASVLDDDLQRFRAAGFDDVIAKPYKFNTIYGCLEKLLGLKYNYH